MNSGNDTGYTAPFDEMLAESQKSFDDLARRPGEDERPRQPDKPVPPSAPTPPIAAAASPAPAKAVASDAGSSAPARALEARFGNRWRYEIADRRREGDEVIVWGRLIVEEAGVDKTRRARARIHRPALARTIEGSADGAEFSLGQSDILPAETNGDPEDRAFREASDAALATCLKGVV